MRPPAFRWLFVTAWHMLTDGPRSGPAKPCWCWAEFRRGHCAIQIAKLFHARVIATAGDERKWSGRGTRRRFRHQPLSAEDLRRSPQDHQFRGRGLSSSSTWVRHMARSVRSLKAGGTSRHLRCDHGAESRNSICGFRRVISCSDCEVLSRL